MDTALAEPSLLSVDDYLRHEADGPVRHEYIGGRIYCMAGASEAHNLICLNLATLLHTRLRNSPCRVYMADFKVHLQIQGEDIFYYPDIMVACRRDGVEKYFLRHPKLIVEVLSPTTEATDRREKLLNYPQIASLEEYVLVSQDAREVTLHRRAERWVPRVLTAPDAVAEFSSLQFSLPLARIYEDVLA